MTMICSMAKASFTLEKYEDAARYCKEQLKICIESYNSGSRAGFESFRLGSVGPVEQYQVMHCYKDLIEAQIKNKSFKEAQKTFKKIKMFNLNSMTPDNVFKALESNGYKGVFHVHIFYHLEMVCNTGRPLSTTTSRIPNWL